MFVDVPRWSKVDNPVNYRVNGTSALSLITVGDSWTYGDSLGKTKVREGNDDLDYRIEHIYGNIMSKELKCSWMNIALPGISNTLMINWLSKFLDECIDPNNTVCVITLTESGRHEDLRLIDRSLVKQQLVLENILSVTYSQITLLRLRFPNVKFVVAHNFTDGDKEFACDKSWLEIMLDKTIQNGTHIVVSEHIEQMNYESRFPDVLDIMERAKNRIDLLDSCKYCYKEDSRHPNEEGHKLWAEYLLTQI